MLDFKLRELMECTKEEKLSCKPLIDQIIDMADLARKEGALALEELIPDLNDYLLKAAITVLVDGNSCEDNIDIIDTLILTSGKKGVALLRQMIIRTGVLAIQAGENPSFIKKRLDVYLGDDLSTVFNR